MRKLLLFFLTTIICCPFLQAQSLKSLPEVECQLSRMPRELQNSIVTYISENGKFVIGSKDGKSFFFDVLKGTFRLDNEEAFYRVVDNEGNVYAIYGNVPTKSGKISPQGEFSFIESPLKEFNMADYTYITPDGKHLVGNLTKSGYETIPYIAEKKEDGAWNFTLLEIPAEDAYGAEPQYTKALFCNDDASMVIGTQTENVQGLFHRVLQWDKNSDNSYSWTAPADTFLYHLEREKPGKTPEYGDYVTAEEGTPEYQQQEAEFSKAYEEWEKNYNAFGKVYLKGFWAKTFNNSRYYMAQVVKFTNEEKSKYITAPFVFDSQTGQSKAYFNHPSTIAGNVLPNGDLLTWIEEPFFYSEILHTDGTVTPIIDWLNSKLKTPINPEDFFYKDPNENFIPGHCNFSRNGKTMVFTGYYPDENMDLNINNVYIRFKSGVLDNQVVKNVENDRDIIRCDGRYITSDRKGRISIFDINGKMLQSFELEKNKEFDLSLVCPSGYYIVKIENEQKEMFCTKIYLR